MVCPYGGFPIIRHNEVRDLTATLLTEVCHNVATEPSLQPISAETFPNVTANTFDDARLDVKARGFWCRGQDAYFDVRVFYPIMPPATAHSVSLLLTSAMRMPRNVNMLERLNMSLYSIGVYLHWWCGSGGQETC